MTTISQHAEDVNEVFTCYNDDIISNTVSSTACAFFPVSNFILMWLRTIC